MTLDIAENDERIADIMISLNGMRDSLIVHRAPDEPMNPFKDSERLRDAVLHAVNFSRKAEARYAALLDMKLVPGDD